MAPAYTDQVTVFHPATGRTSRMAVFPMNTATEIHGKGTDTGRKPTTEITALVTVAARTSRIPGVRIQSTPTNQPETDGIV